MVDPEFAERLREHRKNLKLAGLCRNIDDLVAIEKFDGFPQLYKQAFRELNRVFDEGSIDQLDYDSFVHTIKAISILYIYKKNDISAVSLYQCPSCQKYFLEKKGKFCSEEIHTNIGLKYVEEAACSEECLKKSRVGLE